MLLRKLLVYVRLLFISLTIVYAQDEGHEDESMKDQIDFATTNICNIPNPTIIYCYCNTVEENEANDGNCWIFNDSSQKQYAEVWESFASQTRMKHLTLHLRTDGTLDKVPTVAIMFLPELERFEVQYASINSLHPFCFGNSSMLESISLARNKIQYMEPFSLSNLPSLQTLKLGENQLIAVNSSVFVDLPNLKQLFMDKNNITSIENFAFRELDNLVDMDLSMNEIKDIVPETFVGLISLERLDLHKNLIQVLADMSFQELSALLSLDLRGNSIKYIAPKGLYGLKKLRQIYLQDNKLLSLEEDVFKNTPDLLHLDLRQNVLETLTLETMRPLSKNLKNQSMTLNIKDNVFRCDNRLVWIFKLYKNTNSSAVKSSLEDVYCYLEVGTLPPRLDDEEVTLPLYEVTTMGIGPRTELLKLLPSELPDPLIRTPATLTDEECEEDRKNTGKKHHHKHHEKAKNRRKSARRSKANRKEETATELPDSGADSGADIGDTREGTRDSIGDSNRDATEIEVQSQAAEPVQGNGNSGHRLHAIPLLTWVVALVNVLACCPTVMLSISHSLRNLWGCL